MLFRLLEGIGVLVAAYFLFTQVLLPAGRGGKLFPYFRREGRLKEKLVDVTQALREQELLEELETQMKEAYGAGDLGRADRLAFGFSTFLQQWQEGKITDEQFQSALVKLYNRPLQETSSQTEDIK